MTKVRKTKVYVDGFAISTERRSGIGHVLLNLLLEFDKDPKGFDFVIVASPRAINFIKKEFNFKNIRYKKIPLKGWIFNGLVIYKLMPPVDLYLGKAIYLFPNFTRWPLLFSKSIIFIHDLAFMVYPETLRPGVLGALTRNLKNWSKRCTKIVAVSENTKRDIVKYFNVAPGKISIVHNGVNANDYYQRGPKEIEAVRKKYGLPKDYILFLSNLEPKKNLTTLLKAYRMLPKQLSQKHPIVLVGGESWGSEGVVSEIKEMVKSGYKIVRPKHYVVDEDLPAVYSAASLLVHPALYEGFALSPLQAISVGIPAVVANNSSMKELFAGSAVLFETLDADGLRDAIEKVLTNKKLRQGLIVKGKERAKELSWHKSADDLLNIIKSLS
jgi:glycosyltransferase involved in cell wall biosynthesis